MANEFDHVFANRKSMKYSLVVTVLSICIQRYACYAHDDVFDYGSDSPSLEARLEMAAAGRAWELQHADRDLTQDYFDIPVYFTVFQPDALSGKMDRFQEFVDVLNSGFAQTPFEFHLQATQYVVDESFSKCSDQFSYKDGYRQGTEPWHLDVFVCDLVSTQSDAGQAYLPPILKNLPMLDGVVLMNPALDNPCCSYDRMKWTLIHEVGHWLGLFHTFEGGCDPEEELKREYGSEWFYLLSGDGVSDTPAHSGMTASQPEQQHCYIGQQLNTCPDNIDGVDPGYDPVRNYMNVVDWECRQEFGEFTFGQVRRMVAQFEMWRWNGDQKCLEKNALCQSTDQCCFGFYCTGNNEQRCKPCQQRKDDCDKSSDCCMFLKCEDNKCRYR